MKRKSVIFGTFLLAIPIFLGMTPGGVGALKTLAPSKRLIRTEIKASVIHPADRTNHRRPPRLRSSYVKVVDSSNGSPLISKHSDEQVPVASITKLMTAMVVLDSHPRMDEEIRVSSDDVDRIRHSRSKLPVGWKLTRWQLMNLALMCSENRAAHSLARTYPGGYEAFIEAMNRKADILEMNDSRFFDPTGLDGRNVSTANDLVKLVRAASGYCTIRRMSTTPQMAIKGGRRSRTRLFGNSNRLIHNHRWDILMTKTGYIHEAGYCLVMEARLEERPVIFVLLDSHGKYSRLGDAMRVKRWFKQQN